MPMIRLFAALLLLLSLPAAANPNDPCIVEANLMDSVSRARDEGVRMQDLIRAADGQFDTEEELERYLRKIALAYGNPELSGEEMGDAIHDACVNS